MNGGCFSHEISHGAEAAFRSGVVRCSVLSSTEIDVYPLPDLAKIRLALSVSSSTNTCAISPEVTAPEYPMVDWLVPVSRADRSRKNATDDAARITLADHRAYDLSGFYVVCTSNIGSQQLLRLTRLPFATSERAVFSELHRFFGPELSRVFSAAMRRAAGRAKRRSFAPCGKSKSLMTSTSRSTVFNVSGATP